MHLYLKAKLVEVIGEADNLRATLVNLADKHTYTIMPGYTHTCKDAQPDFFWSPLDGLFATCLCDAERFEFNIKHTDISSPLDASTSRNNFPD